MTTPDIPTKKVVSVEILHLDETGYGPEGKHTRREWRAECLENFEAGAEQFLAWQESWQHFSDQNKLKANFEVQRSFDDGSTEELNHVASQSHCLDFAGHTFDFKDGDDYQDYKDYQFLSRVYFKAATFTGYADFSVATFADHVDFRKATFIFDAYFRGTTFASEANFGETIFTSDADFNEAIFTGRATFNKSTFNGGTIFSKTTFKNSAHFNESTFTSNVDFFDITFTGDVDFSESAFIGDVDFSGTTFSGYVNFSGTTFSGDAWFHKTIFTVNARFSEVTFRGYTEFRVAIFTGYANFTEAIFTGYANFSGVHFKKTVFFLNVKFHKITDFRDSKFNEEADFENATFENVGHFENAKFNTATSKIPSFRGINLIGTSSLEFSDDTHFTKNDLTDDAIKNVAFLKHLSEQHGQIDQALNFNAMELRAKYLQVVEPLRAKSLSWFKRTFKRYLSIAWWALRLTWLYGLLSDFGRSYMRPIFAYGVVFVFTLIMAISISVCHESKNCQNKQGWNVAGLMCDGKPSAIKPNDPAAGKEDDKLYLNGYRAAFEYANYHATGLVDFTGDSKLKDAITQRVFGEPIKPWWARIIGALLSIINTALLFLIALGLRNSYRLK